MAAKWIWRSIGIIGFSLVMSACHQNGTVFAVDSTDDTVDVTPGDGLCADVNGDCSLRAAVMEANSLPGVEEIRLVDGARYRFDDLLAITAAVVVTGDGLIETVSGELRVAVATGLTEFDGPDFRGSFSSDGLVVDGGSLVSIRHADFAQTVLRLRSGALVVRSSSFEAGYYGGIRADAGTARIENSTFTHLGVGLPALLVESRDATVHIVSSTLVNGELFVRSEGTGSIDVKSSIIEGTCGAGVRSLGYNMTGPSCGFSQPGDVDGTAYPLERGLSDNGGEVLTILPARTGPAIDGGPTSACTLDGRDARGVARPVGPACDIGAVELEYGTDCDAPGPGADLAACDFAGADLAGVDLSGADASGASFVGADLTDARLVGTTLTRARVDMAVFDGADLSDADMSFALGGFFADGANFTRARLTDVAVRSAIGADFTDADAQGFDTWASTASIAGAHIEGADFTGGPFWGVTSGGVTGDATGIRVINGYVIDWFVQLDGVDFSDHPGDVVLGNMAIRNSDLSNLRITASWAVRYDGSTLDGSDFSGTYADNSSFREASLVDVDMTGTRLESTAWDGAVVVGVDFSDASLDGADFSDAVLLLNVWDNTTCPSGVNSDDNGGNCDGQFTRGAPSVGGGAAVPGQFQGMGVEDFAAGGLVDG